MYLLTVSISITLGDIPKAAALACSSDSSLSFEDDLVFLNVYIAYCFPSVVDTK